MTPNPSRMPRLSRRKALCLAAAGLASPALALPVLLRVGGTGAALGGIDLLAPALRDGPGLALETVRLLGTMGGLRGVAAGRLEASVSSRPVNAAEQASGLRSRLYATTPLAFATRQDNTADRMSLSQAEAMFTGALTTWPDGTPARVSRRPLLDSDTTLMSGLSPSMAAAVAQLQRRPGIPTAASDHDQAEALRASRGSFGTLGLSMMMTEIKGLKPIQIEEWPVEIGDWPIQKGFHVVTRVQSDPWVEDFLTFLFSAQAAHILVRHGHHMTHIG